MGIGKRMMMSNIHFPIRFLFPLCAFIIGTVVIPSSIHGQTSATPASRDTFNAAAVFQKAVNAYKSVKTLRVEFNQTLVSALTGSKSSAKGELLRKQPNLFSINFKSPETDRIVCDGKHIWMYLPSSAPNQVIKSPATPGGTSLVDPLDFILGSKSDNYNIVPAGTASIEGRSTRAVTLTPRGRAEVFNRATIWVDDKDGSVRKVETKELSGLQRTIVITKYTPGSALSDAEFQFKPAKGMRVIDQQAMSGQKR